MTIKTNIGTTKNGYEVFIIEDNKHMLAHNYVSVSDLHWGVEEIELTPPFGFYTVELPGIMGGINVCVETTESDDIRMECREGRDFPSRMVYGREPDSTSTITIGICTDDDGLETVFTAFYGPLAPKELSDPNLTDEERPEAEAFWANHALVAPAAKFEILSLPWRDEPIHFRINKIDGDVWDFGDIETDFLGRRYLDIDEPDQQICEKYRISKEEFLDFAERLDELISD